MLSSHQSPLSGLTRPCAQAGLHILTKVSKSGLRYFYTGGQTRVEVAGGGHCLVASTSLFWLDAHRFTDAIDACVARNGKVNVRV